MERLYRPNVAGMMVRQDGKLLICERSGQKGAWQFPQGGIDPGETALEAVRREIGEEVGVLPSQYDIVESRKGYCYDYPPEAAFCWAGAGVFPVPAACGRSGTRPG